jgi:hypothetical protein
MFPRSHGIIHKSQVMFLLVSRNNSQVPSNISLVPWNNFKVIRNISPVSKKISKVSKNVYPVPKFSKKNRI